ncbi:MAG: hypothetical protein ACRDAI_03715 [Candidatus Rhabdochlamydia sp.]
MLDEETLIMEQIISSWCSYQNIEQLQNPWERRSFFIKRLKQEFSFAY